jgi:hypothetical protein
MGTQHECCLTRSVGMGDRPGDIIAKKFKHHLEASC